MILLAHFHGGPFDNKTEPLPSDQPIPEHIDKIGEYSKGHYSPEFKVTFGDKLVQDLGPGTVYHAPVTRYVKDHLYHGQEGTVVHYTHELLVKSQFMLKHSPQ